MDSKKSSGILLKKQELYPPMWLLIWLHIRITFCSFVFVASIFFFTSHSVDMKRSFPTVDGCVRRRGKTIKKFRFPDCIQNFPFSFILDRAVPLLRGLFVVRMRNYASATNCMSRYALAHSACHCCFPVTGYCGLAFSFFIEKQSFIMNWKA